MRSSFMRAISQEIIPLIVALPVLLFFLFPLFYLGTISFKLPIEFFGKPPTLLPADPTLIHYQEIRDNYNLYRILLNTAFASFGAMAMGIILGVPAAYGLAKFSFYGRSTLAMWVLSTRLMPPIAIILPVFLLFRNLNMLNSIWTLGILYTAFNLPLVIWIMLNFFNELPRELEEAALIDGASVFVAFWRIALPLARPGIAAVAILCIIFTWNEFIFALILNTEPTKQTLSVGMALFVSERGVLWGPMGALAMVSSLPVILFTLLLRGSFVRGLTFGAVRG